MNDSYLVELAEVDKVFHTRHFFQADEDSRKRRLYKKNRVHAANAISFGIRPGEVFGLLGPNGAGKTTTVKMVSGLVRPDRGTVYVNHMPVEKKRKQVLRHVGGGAGGYAYQYLAVDAIGEPVLLRQSEKCNGEGLAGACA